MNDILNKLDKFITIYERNMDGCDIVLRQYELALLLAIYSASPSELKECKREIEKLRG